MKLLDTAKYLNSQTVIEGYLKLSFKDPNPDVFLSALINAVKAKGINNIAEAVTLSPQEIRDALDLTQKPSFEIVHKLLRALNVNLDFSCRHCF